MNKNTSLEVYTNNETIFTSKGKWLYPLFEFEQFCIENSVNASECFLHDKVAGRAAAALIIRLGIKKCCIDLISEPALELFNLYKVDVEYTKLVDFIKCRTEKLISTDMAIDDVYKMLKSRAGLTIGLSLKLENISSGYENNKVLDNINLNLQKGDQLVITGENGAGKTTLLKTLMGERDYKGDIYINDKNIKQIPKMPSPIGYVNQSKNSSNAPITSGEIVSLGLIGKKLSSRDSKYQIELAMKRTGSYHLINRDINTLSGGEMQRVSIARCLAQQAGIILLDEPTSFLDSESKKELLRLLKLLYVTSNPTIIIVSHDHQWLNELGWETKNLKDGLLC